MKKLSVILLVLSVFLSLICCGCTANEKNDTETQNAETERILADLSQWPLGFEENVEISALNIVKRNVEDKLDEVYVKVIGETESVKCEMYYKLTYNNYTVGGWILDEVEITDEEKWKVVPEKGVDDNELDNIKTILKNRARADYDIDTSDCVVSILSETLSQDKTSQTVMAKLSSKTAKRDFAMEATRVYEFSYALTDNSVSWDWTCVDSDYNVVKDVANDDESAFVVYEPFVEEATVYEAGESTLYRVRKDANNSQSQIGAYKNLNSAIKLADERKAEGYEVYDTKGNMIYNPNGAVSDGKIRYRVRKSANDAQSQLGAYSIFENAQKEADKHKGQGYEVYDLNGNVVYVP